MGGISWNSEVKGAFLDWNSDGILAVGGGGSNAVWNSKHTGASALDFQRGESTTESVKLNKQKKGFFVFQQLNNNT